MSEARSTGGEMRHAHKVLIRESEMRRPLRRPSRVWEDTLKWILKEDMTVDWIHLVVTSVQWQVIENM
jgi:hypothetical protein